MLGVILAFASSILWGASDFAGGVSARASTALRSTLWSFVGATALSLAAIAVYQRPATAPAVTAGIVAGVLGLGGFLTLYAGLAVAPMGVITVIVGAVEAIVPVMVGVFWYREGLSGFAWAGVAVVMAGAALLGFAEGGKGGASLRPVALAVASGALFGLSVVALDAAPADSGLVTPAVEVVVGLALLLALAAGVRRFAGLRRSLVAVGVTTEADVRSRHATIVGLVAGVFLGAANIALLLALREGQLAVVGVVLCLYPLTTAVLARFILREHLTRLHLAGIALALAGCVLLAVG